MKSDDLVYTVAACLLWVAILVALYLFGETANHVHNQNAVDNLPICIHTKDLSG